VVDVAQATTEAIAPPLESGATTEPDRALQPIGTPDSDRPPAAEKRVDRTASSTDPTLERRSAPAPTVEIREAREPGTPSSASDQGSFFEPYAIEASLFKRAARPTQLDRRLESGASVAPDDKLFLTFSASRDLYVYVLNEDDRGEVHLLFPLGSSELVNPLRGGQPHRVPGFRAGKALNWQVSSTGGQEHLLVIASPERLSELENVLGAVPQAQQAQLTDDSRDRYPHSQPVRGIGGLAEEEVSGAVAVPASLLSQVLRLVESESSSPGIWIRRFDLGNQEGREREP
jgi:hypothetical protein